MNSAMTITESTVTAAAPSAKLSKAGPVLDPTARNTSTNFVGTASLTKMKSATTDFPLKSGDGCSILCKVEQGWTCRAQNARAISRCQRTQQTL
jgi:hypothetical protein